MPDPLQVDDRPEGHRIYECDTLVVHDHEERGCPFTDYVPASVVAALEEEVERLRRVEASVTAERDEARAVLKGPIPVALEAAHAEGARQERERLEGLLAEFLAHQSWRCEHPPHFYLAEKPPRDDCPCRLLSTLREAGFEQTTSGVAAVLSSEEGTPDA